MAKNLILVDENDNIIGYEEKMSAHISEKRHRAFSIFIYDFNTKKMLLQRRALNKYHSGGLWSNACCSHPIKDEPLELTINKRLKEELGIYVAINIKKFEGVNHCKTDELYDCGKFSYFAQYNGLSENEIDRVFLYCPFREINAQIIKFNTDEVAEVKWIDIDALKYWIKNSSDEFTAWFKDGFELVYPICNHLSKCNI